MPGVPILTYHSQLLFGSDYATNSHLALAADLEQIHAAGKQIVPLIDLVEALRRGQPWPGNDIVCLSFDDGPDFDWHDIEHPQHGWQRSFGNILGDHAAAHPDQPAPSAASFVIADAAARQAISRNAMDGHDWMHHDWWAAAEASGRLQIESHGWDHRHGCLGADDDPSLGHFHAVADAASCRRQIDDASAAIAALTGRRPRLFAYPFGQASDYLRREYLPRFESRHGIVGAVSTEPGHCHADSDRWFLPRFVHVADWTTPEQLAAILRG